MSHLKWDPVLDTGINVIDQQHKRIVQYINDLYDAQQKGDRAMVGNVIEELVDYTLSHFAFEESLMEEAGYPFIRPHQRIHKLFTERVNTYVSRFNSGDEVAEDLITMLTKWLVNHIKLEDGDYVTIVQKTMKKATVDESWIKSALNKFFGSKS